MRRPQIKYVLLFLVFALLGLAFAAVSTADFVAHLDRQVHSIACSFVPGIGEPDKTGESGCYAALMSPFSSVMRTDYWGGIPVSLAAMSVFAYLLFLGVDVLIRRQDRDPRTMFFVVLASLLPFVTSVVFLVIALKLVGELCKLCVGIYVSSLGVMVFALLGYFSSRRAEQAAAEDTTENNPRPRWGVFAVYFMEGVAFVVAPLVVFLAFSPARAESRDCGSLVNPVDKYGIRVDMSRQGQGTPALEVIDPLCPACRSFRDRLIESEYMSKLDLQAVLFPLDSSCNWMVTSSLHPGACAVSEAVLCAGQRSSEVLTWALDNNEELRATAQQRPEAVYDSIKKQFPDVAACVGTPAARARLNKSLRWIAANSLPVLTPQLFVGGRRLCDEDTDLGLELAMTRLLAAPPQTALTAGAAGTSDASTSNSRGGTL
ncbi:MAG: vitamin K epoxide reductase family protein [Pseudomonadota bacterium]